MKRIAIVGGGPGGLFTASLLEEKLKNYAQVTLFEGTPRTGGKIQTCQFESAPVIYEAGVAELYGYQNCGPDPLRRLVQKLRLKIIPMKGQMVVLRGRRLRTPQDVGSWSQKTLRSILEFRRRATQAMPRDQWYEGNCHYDNLHPWAKKSCEEILDEVSDARARKYLRVSVHSDLATEPHLTNGLNGLKNFLMDVPGYIRLYSIAGGIEQLPRALEKRLTRTRIRTNSSVVHVHKTVKGKYRVLWKSAGSFEREDFDALFIALPHNSLCAIEWNGEVLRRAMSRFIAYYDRPGHYLRVSALFKRRFWSGNRTDSWFVLDAFGGCCVYDESTRYRSVPYGALGWLLAGANALALSNCNDSKLGELVLESLPGTFRRDARKSALEVKVHRWLASVSAQPGGLPILDTRSAHVPEPEGHPQLFMVGDYLFDSTLNGVLDSAQSATDLFESRLLEQRSVLTISQPMKRAPSLVAARFNKTYFDNYHNGRSYRNTYREYFDAEYVTELIRLAWDSRPPYSLLDAGSASGLSLNDFGKQGIEAWGVERCRYIHRQTPRHLISRNLLGDICNLKFGDNSFDFVYETCLAYLPKAQLCTAIRELRRVTRRGVIFASITSDMNPKILNRHSLLRGMRSFLPLWEWGELFLSSGFSLAVGAPKRLNALWRCERKYNYEDDDWYADQASFRYCFYTKIDS